MNISKQQNEYTGKVKCAFLPQVQLYEDFAKSRAKQGIEETVNSYGARDQSKEKKNHTTTHVFQVNRSLDWRLNYV